MMDSSSDLTTVLTGLANSGAEVGFRSGTVLAWNAETGENTVEVGGTPITDLPILITSEKLAIRPGDVVAMLRTRDQFFILGRLTVDAGALVVRSADGQVQVSIGRTPAGGGEIITRHSNGVTHTAIGQLINEGTEEIVGQGFVVQRANGVDLIGAGPLTPGGPEMVRINDAAGARAFATAESTEGLLDKPYLDVPMYVNNSSGSHSTTSALFFDMWRGRMHVTHPALHAHVFAWVTAADTTGQIAVQVNGLTTHAVTDITNVGPPGQFYNLGTELLPSTVREAPYSFVPVVIRARVQSGAGSVVIIPYGFTKRGEP